MTHTLHTARRKAAAARKRHDAYREHLIAQGTLPTVEERGLLAALKRDLDLCARELDQEQRIVRFRRQGVAA